MSSQGKIWVGVLVYPVITALWTAAFVVVWHMQLSCWISDNWCQRRYLSMCPATYWYLKHPVNFFFVERRLQWMFKQAALSLILCRSFELNISAGKLSHPNVAFQPETL